jgi:hypothetical protein
MPTAYWGNCPIKGTFFIDFSTTLSNGSVALITEIELAKKQKKKHTHKLETSKKINKFGKRPTQKIQGYLLHT